MEVTVAALVLIPVILIKEVMVVEERKIQLCNEGLNSKFWWR